jgi:AGCS family alanine or glycine:cation symporter
MTGFTRKLLVVLLFNVFAFNVGAFAEDDKKGEGTKEELTLSQKIDNKFRPVVDAIASVLFVDPFEKLGLHDPKVRDSAGNPVINAKGEIVTHQIPLVVIWLISGAVFFTLRMKFLNIWGVKHAIALVRGVYDNPDDEGEVSHFQALTTALSATVGLGNIAGVAVAVSLGGPGASLWMVVAGLFGMTSKFVECTLGVKYRTIGFDGRVSGGPMYYLSRGLEKRNLKWLGKILAGLFAILCIGGSFGGGNMFQANQAFAQFSGEFTFMQDHGFWFGVVMAVLVGIVIIGGIRSIAKVTDKIVPVMVASYVITAIVIIGMNWANLGEGFAAIWNGAFDADALKGGFLGVLVTGFQRSAFSNEAGVGSASIAHSASKTNEPVSEGIVALLEPFIDTVVVCTMTALVLIFTGFADGGPESLEGSELTAAAFSSVFPWFKYLLIIAIVLFAFSTMISWSYYGLKSWTFLFGQSKGAIVSYKMLFLLFIIVGASSSLGAVLDFSDMMILGMAFPNIFGLYFLVGEVKKDLDDYFKRIKTGEIKRFK